MAIDVFSEKVLSLKEAIALLPKSCRNKKLNLSTVYRWILTGLRSRGGKKVKLESIKVGGTTCTSKEALQRFFDGLSGGKEVVTPPTEMEKERLRRIRLAEKELDRLGI